MSTEKITERDDEDIVAIETGPDQDDERLAGSADDGAFQRFGHFHG
jgi:hypothetical protein